MCIIDCLSTIVFILPLHLDYTKVIILILWWRNFQLEYWRTFQLVSTFKEYVNKLFSERAVVEVKKKLPNRTLAQNSYLHLLLGYFGSEYGCSLDEAKIDFYKRTCNRDLFERKTVNKKGKEVTYLRSSAELTTGEMTLSIDRFRNWSASVAGIYLPAANEHQMLIYAQQEIQRNQEFI